MKYGRVYTMWLQRFLTYRARVLIWTLVDTTPFIIFPFIWLTVYSERADIAGYDKTAVITYYLITALISMGFTSHGSRRIKEVILNGQLSAILVRPVNFFWYQFMEQGAYKLLSGSLALSFFVIGRIIYPEYIALPTSLFDAVAFIVMISLCFLISHLITFILGLVAFWFGEIRAVQHFYEINVIVFSGRLAPLVFLPPVWQIVSGWLPFKYLAVLPANVYLGKLSALQIRHAVYEGVLWLALLSLIAFYVWRRGLRRYEGVGI